MKIVIAAAGRGTRMQALAKNTPKPLIKVSGRPFLYYLLENVKKAGYTEIIVVGGYLIDQMQDFLKGYDPNIILVDQNKHIIDRTYGTACPLKSARYFVLDEDFVFCSGDNLYAVADLAKFIQLPAQNNYIGGRENPHPENYGVLQTTEGFLKKIIEKPTAKIGNLINTGLYKFTKEIFTAVNQITISQRGELELTDAINLLATKQRVKVEKLTDYWYDFGKPEDIKKIEQFILCAKKL